MIAESRGQGRGARAHSRRRDRPSSRPLGSRLRLLTRALLLLLLLLLAGALPWAAPGTHASPLADLGAPGRARGHHVLLVTLDTVRADHLGCYGHRGARTPTIDALARPGIRFTQAIPPTPITLPSHTTILTGLEVPDHGVRNNGTFRLDPSFTTLAEALQGAGYATGAFIAAYVLDDRYGLAQGFEVYDDQLVANEDFARLGHINRRGADAVTASALGWLEQVLADGDPRPFFAWVHYFDPHLPHLLPAAYAEQFRDHPYDGTIAFVDEQLARIVDLLRRRGAIERTLIVLTADHGEGLGEHGESSHSRLIYDSTMHVPLILSCPTLFPQAVTVDDRVVALCDVFPTVLDLVGVQHAGLADGRNLLTAPAGDDRAIYIETMAPLLNNGWASLHGLRRLHDKYILAPRPEYYDLRVDPGELDNRYALSRRGVEELAADLRERMASWAPVEEVGDQALGMDPEQTRRLRALGYVNAAGRAGGAERPDPKDMIAAWERSSRALELSLQGDHEKALIEIERALRENPKDAQAWQHAALINQRMGKIRQALAAISRAIHLYPTAERYVKLAQYHMMTGQLEHATRAADRAEELDAREGGIHVVRGQILCARGAFEQALGEFERALDIDPVVSGPIARRMIAKTREQLGQ